LRTGQRVLAVLRNGGGYAEEIVLDAAAAIAEYRRLNPTRPATNSRSPARSTGLLRRR
jgi:hypothetical protein